MGIRVDNANDAALATTNANLLIEALARANADTAIHAVYKPFVWRNTIINDAQTASTRLASVSGAVVGSTSNTTTAAAVIFYINATELAVSGLTTKMNLQMTLSTNATSPTAITVTGNLHAVTAVAGTADVSAVTLGSAVSGASVAVVDQAASTSSTNTSGDFTVPSSGLHAITVQNSATPAADTFYSVTLCLRYRHV